MNADVEDGKPLESAEENKIHRKGAYMHLNRGISAARVWHSVPSSGGGCELGYMETLTRSSTESRRIPEGLPTSESENDDDGSECSEDERPSKKSRVFGRVPETSSTVDDPNAADSKLGLKKSQKNSIWANVIQDQILSNDLMGWNGLEQPIGSDRDVESYNYVKARDVIRSNPASSSDPQQIDRDVESDLVPDLSEMETFGTKTSKKTMQLGDKSLGIEDCDPGRPWLKRRHNGSLIGSIHSRLGSRISDESRNFSRIKATSSDQPSIVADELMRVLREPENMKETFERVVQTIGVEAALKFLHETEDIENSGGLMTKDGYRRRTPGGVYLFLVKNGVTKEQSGVIFQNQRDDIKRHKKLWKAKQKKMLEKRRQTMEIALGLKVSEAAKDAVSSATAVARDEELVTTDQPLKMEEEDGLDPYDPSVNIELG